MGKSAKAPDFQQTVIFMDRQAELLDEEGNDVSARVMRDAMKVVVAEHQRVLALEAEVRELNERVEKAVDEAGDRIMKMSDKQIEALCRLEGHDPKDRATIVKQAMQIAGLRVELQQAKDTRAEALPTNTLWAKVTTFRALTKNWDSYGAQPFPEATIQLAIDVSRHLTDEWKVVPCADGPSVHFYRGDEDEIIEVRTMAPETIAPLGAKDE